jgi:hypothetical protein
MSIILSSASIAGKSLILQSARKPANYFDRVYVNAKNIMRKQGVSALLAFWQQELEKRPAASRSACWRPLLRMARSIVWSQNVRYGETLEVGFDFVETEPGAWLPYIWAYGTGSDNRSAKWFADPERNVLIGWDQEVRG